MTTSTTRPPRQRVVFYSHDAAGLGHISRCLTVIEELARRRRDLAILLVTGAPKIDLFPLPFNVDIVRIPVATRRPVYDDAQPITDLHGLTSVYSVRGQIIEAAAVAFRPDVFVADQTPLGLANELRPLLASLPAAVPACRFVVSMDDAGE